MNCFIQFFKNLHYLSKFSLKSKFSKELMEFKYEDILENFLYYLPDSQIFRPEILDSKRTIQLLKTSHCSLARFGDGELMLISGKDIPYQVYDEELAEKMKEILLNKQKNLLVGINHWYFHCKYNPKQENYSRSFELFTMPIFRKMLLNHIDINTIYCDAGFTGLEQENNELFENLREIWNNKKILIITCENAIKNIKYNIYDNASMINYLFVPNKNAYSEYKNVLTEIKKYEKDTLIILMCGPLAKILASDFSKQGYTALDLGHILKSYDYNKREIKKNPETTIQFYSPDE